MSDWRDDAACIGVDPEAFYPIGHSREAAAVAQAAIRVCARCPVTDRCAEFAEDHAGATGVWAGVWLDRPPSSAQCGTVAGYREHLRVASDACGACLTAERAAIVRRTAREARRA